MIHFNRIPGAGTGLLVFLLVSLLVVGAGLVAGSGDIRSGTVIAGALLALLLLMKPIFALYCAVISSLVIVGLAQLYIPELQFIRWSVAMLAAALAVLAIVTNLNPTHYAQGHRPVSPLVWWMTGFAVLGLAASASNQPTVAEFAFGFKGYFQIWGLFFAIALMRWQQETVDSLPKILVWIALFQLPFVLHQFFVLVPTRVGLHGGIVAEDVVAGTLGASATGGGANAVLSILLIVALAVLTSLYKRGLLSPARLSVAAVFLLLPLFLNANRIALLYVALGYVMLFYRDLHRSPGRTLAVGMVAVTVLFGILWTYATLLSRSEPNTDLRSFVTETINRNVSTEEGYGLYELNRWTSITFWAQEHRSAPLLQTLVGHGLGASREAEGGALEVNTLAQSRYEGMRIGLTAVSGLLWEVGLAGFLCLIAVFGSALRSAQRLESFYAGVPWRAAVFQGLQVGIVVMALSLFHKNSFLRHLPYQALFVTILGYIAYWQAEANRRGIDHR